MKIKYYILTFLLFAAGITFAQTAKFNTYLSKNQVGTGEQFEITFGVNGNGDNFTPPDLSAFRVLAGPNFGSSMTSINGNVTIQNYYSYILMAIKEGDFTIGPASIDVIGKKLTSNAVTIKVVKGQPVPPPAQDQNPTGSTIGESKADLEKSLLLRADVDKDNVYQGQQLTLSFKVYTRIGIVQSQVTKMPDLTGFWNEEIKNQQPQAQWHVETYKGLKYNVATIKQTILFAEHSGNIKIDPFEMNLILREQAPPKDAVEQFFGGSFKDVKYTAKSLPIIVHVKPLPEAGKPTSFVGAVGNFSIDAKLNKTHVKANDELNYKISVTGSGNIKLLKNLNASFPADFEKYDPQITDTISERVSGVAGTRLYSYLLIPRHHGDYTIDPVKFSYFNPATNRYVSLTTKGFQVKVDKGKTETNVTAFSGDKTDPKLLDKDIRSIKTGDAQLVHEGDEFFGSVGYYALLLLGPLLCIAAYNYRNWRARYNSDAVKVKSRKASRIAAKHMANAQKQLAANNNQAFYEAVFRGLYGYLTDKLNISFADLNQETITAALKARSVSEGVITRLTETLDLCEMARYAPVTHISEKEVFEKSKSIISDIENEI